MLLLCIFQAREGSNSKDSSTRHSNMRFPSTGTAKIYEKKERPSLFVEI